MLSKQYPEKQAPPLCGLARDAGTPVYLFYRVDVIAGSPLTQGGLQVSGLDQTRIQTVLREAIGLFLGHAQVGVQCVEVLGHVAAEVSRVI